MRKKQVSSRGAIAAVILTMIVCGILIFNSQEESFALKQDASYRVKVKPVIAGVFQTGKTINLCVMRSSDFYRFDFADSSWADSGWTTKTVTLSEETDADSPYYYYDFDYPAANPSGGDIVYTFFAKGDGFNFYDIQDISYEWMRIGVIQ